ncbi:uncharacterized protein TRIREDRAFT_107111 [Trichoderma reesei QM6a]|uniref:Predicted protein n=2 Tax=Hypocrea jecorina TaxID=51453 RepID=G0RIE1_HYPJQ|nr:uncharacterized protein TRIREDRAFT_107111 [Trichoderma reesei QM6a]EGR49017.1 predicted protein [Trichoderma reesei QM6a]ETS02344.1 hypothetical protein M419DRAFT_34900 [Trichoderma reesei RUT C-30]
MNNLLDRPLPGQIDEETPINIRISSSPPISLPLHTRQRPRYYETYAYEPPQNHDGLLNVPRFFQPSQTHHQPSRSMMQLGSSSSIVTSMPTDSLYRQTTPVQDLGDVIQFNRERANAVQRRNEASQIKWLNASFDWHDDDSTNQWLRPSHHPDANISSQEETFSTDTRLFADQLSDSFGETSWQATESYPASTHDPLDPSTLAVQDVHRTYIASLASEPQQHERTGRYNSQQALEVDACLERMVSTLDAHHRGTTMGMDATGPHDALPTFMCPYAMRYPDRVSYSCFQKLNTIPYVKQHLRHSHHDAIGCLHKCQKSKSRPNLIAGLSFGPDMCFQINGRRSDRSKSHKEQWNRIYQILFPGADRIAEPSIGYSTVKRLRGLFKFMKTHGADCLSPVYAQLPRSISFPAPEVMYRRAFCTWLPRVFERQSPLQGQVLLGDFLNQINIVLRDNSFVLDCFSGSASLRNAATLRQMDQPNFSFTSMSQTGLQSSQQPSYSATPSTYITQHQGYFQPMTGASFCEAQYNPSPSEISYLNTPIEPQANSGFATPTPLLDEATLDSQFDRGLDDFLFDQFSPRQGSPSQFLDIDVDNDLSQLTTEDPEL